MDQNKIDQVLAIVNQGLVGHPEVTYVSTPNRIGISLHFFTTPEGIVIVDGLLLECHEAGLFFNTSTDNLTWALDYFYETIPATNI